MGWEADAIGPGLLKSTFLRFRILLSLSLWTCCIVPAIASDTVIHAGTLIDAVSKSPRHRVSIIIHDDKIASVEDGFTAPVGAQILDLSTATVLP
jgi:hypothetical protein